MTTVTWVRDADGNYEISSPEHLIQLMNKGSLYSDAGDAPASTDYWAETSKYAQTADVDLLSHHEHIVPIGNSADPFVGSYDGGSNSISNWSYANTDNSVESVGLFGQSSGSTLQNIRLAGVWTVGGFGGQCGFLGAYLSGDVYNCEGNFDTGSTISGDPTVHSSSRGLGTLIGYYYGNGSIHGLTVRGTIDIARVETNTGGVIGRAWSKDFSIKRVRNFATFPSGIKADITAGGIIGDLGYKSVEVSDILNAMYGDIESNSAEGAGGVCGKFQASSDGITTNMDNIINAMTGNIQNADGAAAGGIIGRYKEYSRKTQFSKFMNYMNGDIIGTRGGGLIGTTYMWNEINQSSLTNSIVAMNGTVEEAVVQNEIGTRHMTQGVHVVVNTEFGMTYTAANNFVPETSVGDGFLEHPLLQGLPYVDLSGTDEKGNVYDWEFVYANVGGNAKFSAYTHAILHRGKMSAVFEADFGTLSQKAISFANTSTGELSKHGSMEVLSTNATTVLECQFPPTWVLDADGNYEVSSLEHLLQVMHKGALYSDAGDAPSSYWGADTKYVQTRDIDLLYHQQHIVPIGSTSDEFKGNYDGGNFEIRNWSYGNTDNSVEHIGLFGVTSGSILQNIRLSGVWTIGGFGNTGGFLCGRMTLGSELYNCEGDFDVGTTIAGGPASGAYSATLIGECMNSTIHGLTLRGTVDLAHSPNVRGGVIGWLYGGNVDSTISHVRNVATFPSGNSSDAYCGGVVGYYSGGVSVSNMLNAMHGDLQGSHTGGIIGVIFSFSAVDIGPIDSLVNAMTGNITGTGCTGGIVGVVQPLGGQTTLIFTRLLNYATGNIQGGGIVGGGIFGKFDCTLTGDDLLYELKDSIVAMNGSVDHAVIASIRDVPLNTVDVVVNTDFGLTFTTNDYTPAPTVGEGFVEDPLFPDLPFVEFSSTDAKGNVYNWDFVYANVGGKADYSDYTHAILHKGQVSAPFFADFGLRPERHLAYANLDTGELFANGDLEVLSTNAPAIVERFSPLTWVMDTNGNYEVSSVRHLVQIMHNGGRYQDEGDAPPSGQYMAATTKYMQTADIDLSYHHAFVLPIGETSNMFAASYDGGGFEIRQWATRADSVDSAGLFGRCNGSTLQNIRLTGVWTMPGFEAQGGFLCGRLDSGSVFNCEGNFDTGTTMFCKRSQRGNLGTMIGEFYDNGTIHGLTVRGTVDLAPQLRHSLLGGLIGYVESRSTNVSSISRARNLATFPSGIISTYRGVGGVIGYGLCNFEFSNIVNAMHGDIQGYDATGVGGVIGSLRTYASYTELDHHVLDNIVNTMTGNITGRGGIIGYYVNQVLEMKMTRLINYMSGDIISRSGGGLIGYYKLRNADNTHVISNSIVAMNGTVENALIDEFWNGIVPGGGVSAVVNTDFGMTYDTIDYTPATSVGEGFLEFPAFPDLPYVDMSGTDEKGNVYDWDFVYANVGGKEEYSAYTHASIHTGKMSAPFSYDFGEVTGRYLAFANVETGELFADGAIIAVITDATTVQEYSPSTLETQVSPIAVTTTVIPVAGAVDLKLTYQAPEGEEQTAFTGFLGGVKNIDSLDSETEYTLRLYADMGTGAGYELQESSIASTPANTAENYQVEDFMEDGKIRLDRLSKSAKARMSSVMNELFSTGDDVELGTVGKKRFPRAKFVNRGGTHRIRDVEAYVEALLLPFDADSGPSQTVNLQLSDDSITAVLFDESANTVSIESSMYTPGDIFVIDGLKCTVFEDV